MESNDLTVARRLFQTLATAILKALDAVFVFVLGISRSSETAERKNLAGF